MFDEQGCEALDPPVDGDVVDLDTASDQQFLDIMVGEVVTEVPPDGYQDHVGWEPEPGEIRALMPSWTPMAAFGFAGWRWRW
jgi:hypothetical protein